ncbi:MAG: glutathione S-transferase family protein [Deltaproteobacteria bacterium]
MKLYYCPKTRGTRPRWMLEELGLSYELSYVDLRQGEQKRPEFLAVNPMGGIPALEDGAIRMFESAAIVMYLADKYGQGSFSPALNSPERASYYQWMFFSMTSLDAPIVQYFYHSQFYPEEKRVPSNVMDAKGNFQKAAQVLTQHLEKNEFVLGKSFSAADVMIGSNLVFAKGLGLLEEFPTLQNYVQKLVSRAAFRKATAD